MDPGGEREADKQVTAIRTIEKQQFGHVGVVGGGGVFWQNTLFGLRYTGSEVLV